MVEQLILIAIQALVDILHHAVASGEIDEYRAYELAAEAKKRLKFGG